MITVEDRELKRPEIEKLLDWARNRELYFTLMEKHDHAHEARVRAGQLRLLLDTANEGKGVVS